MASYLNPVTFWLVTMYVHKINLGLGLRDTVIVLLSSLKMLLVLMSASPGIGLNSTTLL